MRDSWREKFEAFKLTTDVPEVLDGAVVWLGRTAAGPAATLADDLTEVFAEAGADVVSRLPEPRGIVCGLDVDRIDDADAVLMLGETPGVTAEAIDFCRDGPWGRPIKSRMHVVLPDEYRGGYMYSRLNELGASNDLYLGSDIEDGKLAMISLYRAISIYRTAKLEQREAEAPLPSIGIVTALQLEFEAVTRAMPGGRRLRIRSEGVGYRTYVHLVVDAEGGGRHQVVVFNAGMSNNKAVAAARQLMNDYPSVRDVIMVGIAGGVPNLADARTDVRLGDIVISDDRGVIKYDMKKVTSDGEVRNHELRPPSHDWLTLAREIATDPAALTAAWEDLDGRCLVARTVRPAVDELLDEPDPADRRPAKRPEDPTRIPDRPRVMFGTIGSADTVVKSAKARDAVASELGIMAFEMEGSGIAEVMWQGTRGYLVVRGICDYCNDAKTKEWQPYAAAAAASFVRQMIGTMPVMTQTG